MQPAKLKDFVERYKDKQQVSVVQGLFSGEDKSNHVLYNKCQKVETKHKAYLKDLISIMYRTMKAESGIGIAANQIGVDLQIFIIEFLKNSENKRYNYSQEVQKMIFINPVIQEASETLLAYWHGCLSARKKQEVKWLVMSGLNTQHSMKIYKPFMVS